ncbi:MAG: DUF6440 family protein [Planctomycetes bacterium]|nr:DUF6440 family protein [Planctomycetota bacterium]
MTDVLAAFLIVILLSTMFHGTAGRDDSDEQHGKRSGLTVYTDYKTGCQYLGTILGGVTPRLDRDGKPVCVSPDEPKP